MNLDWSQFGPAGPVIAMLVAAIAALAGVIVYLYLDSRKKDKRIDELQEKRVEEANKHKEDVVEPLKQYGIWTKYLYDHTINNKQGS